MMVGELGTVLMEISNVHFPFETLCLSVLYFFQSCYFSLSCLLPEVDGVAASQPHLLYDPRGTDITVARIYKSTRAAKSRLLSTMVRLGYVMP